MRHVLGAIDMSTDGKRAIAGAGTVIVAAASNIATGVVTQHWALAWWIATGVLVLLGGGLQAWLTFSSAASNRQVIKGTKVGGSIRQVIKGQGEQSVTDSEVNRDLTQEQR
jgi:hypothetical protein